MSMNTKIKFNRKMKISIEMNWVQPRESRKENHKIARPQHCLKRERVWSTKDLEIEHRRKRMTDRESWMTHKAMG
jgi:hypothetical protein